MYYLYNNENAKYVKVKGKDMYLYQAIDRNNETVDFYFSSRRDKKTAVRFFERMFKKAGISEEFTMDKSGANLAAIIEINKRLEKIEKHLKYRLLNDSILQN